MAKVDQLVSQSRLPELLLSHLSGRQGSREGDEAHHQERGISITAACLNRSARADEPKVITLSCEGTLTPSYGANKLEAPQLLQKTGVVINLDEQTVFLLGYVIPSTMSMRPASTSVEGRQSSTVLALPSGATLIG